MRPLRLEVQGFTCYRDPQPALDFTGMSLFAIAGPTGAGKSTLLDAILYALYGTLPRLSGRDARLSEFISHGSNVLSVCLDFRSKGDTYRLVRKAKVSSKGQLTTSATLAQLVGEAERSLASGVNEVDAAVQERLGIDFNAFTQTVILPQNQFAAFLRAKPREQRTILQHLLGHAIYPAMRSQAERRRADLALKLHGVDEQLEQLAGATPEALAALGAELAQARVSAADASGVFANLSEELDDLRRRRNLTVELEKWTAEASQITAAEPSIAAASEALLRGRRAAAVMPLVHTHAEAQGRSARAAKAASEAEGAAAAAKKALGEAAQALAEATAGAAPLEDWRTQLRRFDQIEHDLSRLPVLTKALAEAQEVAKGADQKVREAERHRQEARPAADAALRRLEEARAHRDAVQSDPQLLSQLEAHLGDAADVRASLKNVKRLERELKAARKQLAEADAQLGEALTVRETAGREYEQAASFREMADREYEEGTRVDMAVHLRHSLVPGQPCPVCDQAVAVLPAATAAPKLVALERQRDKARTTEEAARATSDAAATAVTVAETTAAPLRPRVPELERELAAEETAQAERTARIMSTLALADGVAADDMLKAFENALVETRAAGEERKRREQVVADAEKAAAQALQVDDRARQALVTETERLERTREDVARCTSDLEAARTRIAAVTTAADPAAERKRLEQQVATAERALNEARSREQDARQESLQADARVSPLRDQASAADRDLTQAESTLSGALTEHGFDSTNSLEQAARPAEELARLERQIHEHNTRRATAKARLRELEEQIAGRPVTAAELSGLEERVGAARAQADSCAATVVRLDERHQRLTADLLRAGALRDQRTALSASHAITSEMESDLRSDGFQDFLLTEAFRGLVRGASTRLREMSDRYTMDWRDGNFFVLDHDNGGQRRRTETLSGGETFMASLCLALQLSDEILHASGALRMDSLFIDEGFGSLDGDSLSDVTNALENLRDGDRLIGIISHVPELTERLPGCIRIVGDGGVSSWSVDRVG